MTEHIRAAAAAAAKTDTAAAGEGRRHGAVAGPSTQSTYSILPTVGTSTVLTSCHTTCVAGVFYDRTEQQAANTAGVGGGDTATARRRPFSTVLVKRPPRYYYLLSVVTCRWKILLRTS